MIERKLKAYGLKKVIPDEGLLAEAYRAFRRSDLVASDSRRCRRDSTPRRTTARTIRTMTALTKRPPRSAPPKGCENGLRDPRRARRSAVGRCCPDRARRNALDRVREEKHKAKKKSGDFADDEDDEP